MKKECNKCFQRKSLNEFNSGKCKGKHSWCKACVREYDFRRHKTNEVKRRKQNVDRRHSLQKWLRKYKSSLSCECGENHPACLDFHHRDPSTKLDIVGNLTRRGFSIQRILEEIQKCDVLCANCHRKLEGNKRDRKVL